jgi:hypothetical protein
MTNAIRTIASDVRDRISSTTVKELADMNQKKLDAKTNELNSAKSTAHKKKIEQELEVLTQNQTFFKQNPKQVTNQLAWGLSVILPYFLGGLALRKILEEIMSYGDDEEEKLTEDQKAIREAYIKSKAQEYAINWGIDPVANMANTIFGV